MRLWKRACSVTAPMLGVAALFGVAALLAGCGDAEVGERDSGDPPAVVVLGIDGFDWRLTDPLVAAGRMPNLREGVSIVTGLIVFYFVTRLYVGLEQGEVVEVHWWQLVPGLELSFAIEPLAWARGRTGLHGLSIFGDLKYGAQEGLPDRSVALHARRLEVEHPTLKQPLRLEAPVPAMETWRFEGA